MLLHYAVICLKVLYHNHSACLVLCNTPVHVVNKIFLWEMQCSVEGTQRHTIFRFPPQVHCFYESQITRPTQLSADRGPGLLWLHGNPADIICTRLSETVNTPPHIRRPWTGQCC